MKSACRSQPQRSSPVFFFFLSSIGSTSSYHHSLTQTPPGNGRKVIFPPLFFILLLFNLRNVSEKEMEAEFTAARECAKIATAQNIPSNNSKLFRCKIIVHSILERQPITTYSRVEGRLVLSAAVIHTFHSSHGDERRQK